MKTAGYDLEERTAAFGEAVIEFWLNMPVNPVTAPIINQLVRAATSVGANSCQADDAESKKDFRHKIALCRKESRETKYWLRMTAKASATHKTALPVNFGPKRRNSTSSSSPSFARQTAICAVQLRNPPPALVIRHWSLVILPTRP